VHLLIHTVSCGMSQAACAIVKITKAGPNPGLFREALLHRALRGRYGALRTR
jgi:hypothetical protein